MVNSAGGQDESNPVLWLATRAGKMELSCPLVTIRRVPLETFPRKPNIDKLVLLLRVYGRQLRLGP